MHSLQICFLLVIETLDFVLLTFTELTALSLPLTGTDTQIMMHDPRVMTRGWALEGGHSMSITAM
jgi:hypothetical protein